MNILSASRYFLISVFLFFNIYAQASNNSLLEKKFHDLVERTGEDLNIGVYVEDLETGKVKFSFHQDRRFVPASTTKLFTAYAALETLGSKFKFKTVLSSEANPRHKMLDGNLYVKFYGDPSLSYKNLVDIIRGLNISNITGDIVIDDTLFDDYRTSAGGLTWDDIPFCFAAPNSAIIIDDNCSEAKMWPNKKIGNIANLKINNPYVLSIENTVDTVRPRRSECPYKSRYLGNNTYEVYGCMFNNLKKPVRLNFALPDNRLMAKEYFKKVLKDVGVNLKGRIKFGKAKQIKILSIHNSPELKDLLVPIMHHSMNIASASLFKYMGHRYTGKQGSDEGGENMMKNFLRSKGIDVRYAKIKDGVGASRYNMITPKILVDLLRSAYNSKRVRTDFINSMPQYGDDSTLRYRKINHRDSNRIYAKSGSFKNTSSLAGYYLNGKSKKYAFAIMINNHNLSYQDAKELEDEIIELTLFN
ncbi:MAG: D-alanyl-D-alanine carboxypeptidase/D-alanyl-D-alanine-endopeptidase [Alphaproteobacteria bacterium]|nr:D-alanyl-D-alanine carboxypeptidase/D-alanyl-D-alanine-endopeptidase [Alphaproteobacteria bacterium]